MKRIIFLILVMSLISLTVQAQENVIVSKPIIGKIERILNFTGETRPIIESYAACDVSGPVAAISVEDGQKVKAGQSLATIDKSRFALDYRLMEASLDIAKQQEIEAKKDYDRNKTLHDKGAITQKTFDRAETLLINAKSSLKQAKANFDRAKLDLERCEIKSPIDGYFVDRSIEIGQAMQRGQNMGMVIDLDTIFVEAQIPGNDIRHIKIGQKCLIEGKLEGTVSFINLYADNSRSFKVKIAVPNPDLMFKANMFVKGQITLEEYNNVALFPSRAIRNYRGKYVVYTVDGTKAKRQEISIIAQDGESTYAKEINADTTLVLVGQDNLSEESEVIIREQ